MNILIKWIFKAEQAFYATTIRFFPTLAINQGLLSEWDDRRLTSELNQYRKTCRELKELLNRTQQHPGITARPGTLEARTHPWHTSKRKIPRGRKYRGICDHRLPPICPRDGGEHLPTLCRPHRTRDAPAGTCPAPFLCRPHCTAGESGIGRTGSHRPPATLVSRPARQVKAVETRLMQTPRKRG